MQVLTEEQLNVLFDYMTQQNQISSIEQVFAEAMARRAEMEKKAEEEKLAAEEKARLDRLANPTTEDLLKEIRDLLKKEV